MTTETVATGRTGLQDADVQQLATALRGELIQPGDPTYDDTRAVRNGLIDRYPAIFVRCSGVADVVECVNFAREHGLLLSVRGGAHNVAGNAVNDGGLVEEMEALLRASYGANYDRLAALKAEYDRDNLFRVNLNIPPRT